MPRKRERSKDRSHHGGHRENRGREQRTESGSKRSEGGIELALAKKSGGEWKLAAVDYIERVKK